MESSGNISSLLSEDHNSESIKVSGVGSGGTSGQFFASLGLSPLLVELKSGGGLPKRATAVPLVPMPASL